MRTLLILLVLACSLQACGLKGPLVLPPETVAKPAPAVSPAAPQPAPQDQ